MGANGEEELCPKLTSNELPEELVTQILLCGYAFRWSLSCDSSPSANPETPPLLFGIDKGDVIFVGGSCNGLVCLFDYRALQAVIWNPATKETKVVPKSNVPCFAPSGFFTHNEGMGFGFDAKTNDYKIIHLFYMADPDDYLFDSEREVIHQTEVYSLSADSWRKVDGPPCCLYSMAPKTYINGMASWDAESADVDGLETILLSFDMSDEVFLKTPLPYDITRGFNLFVLNESIAMAATIWNKEL